MTTEVSKLETVQYACYSLLSSFAGAAKCPDGSQETNCLQSPCEMASCPAHPSATCKEDYCGGCNYYFIEGDTKYAGRDCYVVGMFTLETHCGGVNSHLVWFLRPIKCLFLKSHVEDAGQKAYTAAKEVLAQHGKMAYDELLRKMHEKLDMPLIQTNHKYLDPSHASFNPGTALSSHMVRQHICPAWGKVTGERAITHTLIVL